MPSSATLGDYPDSVDPSPRSRGGESWDKPYPSASAGSSASASCEAMAAASCLAPPTSASTTSAVRPASSSSTAEAPSQTSTSSSPAPSSAAAPSPSSTSSLSGNTLTRLGAVATIDQVKCVEEGNVSEGQDGQTERLAPVRLKGGVQGSGKVKKESGQRMALCLTVGPPLRDGNEMHAVKSEDL